jgi:GNAT superfamily N-acetyltransferase
MEFEMREVATQEVDEVVQFHNRAYGDLRTSEQWEWEWKSHYPDLSVYMVVHDGKRIIATQGMMPVYLQIAGKRVLSGKSDQTLLAPEHRGGDLFRSFYDYAVSQCRAKGMCCVWGYTPAVKALRRFGFRVFEDVMYYSASVLDFRKAFAENLRSERTWRSKGKQSLSILVRALRRQVSRLNTLSLAKAFRIEDGPLDAEDLAALYARLRSRYPALIHIDMDQAYLQWRVIDHPFIRYRTFSLYQGSELKGYAIINHHFHDTAFLADLTFEDDNSGAVILQRVLGFLRHADATHVAYFGNRSSSLGMRVFGLLRRFGFKENVNPQMAFVLRNVSFVDEERLFDIEDWYMYGLWTEGYRI